ncbi:MAG: hypothetical protein DWI48_02655 [Chloroflexi bacterium]|nr:MAG: hypothetical protein DWI48_02655 [Chloroflexota bacterium]
MLLGAICEACRQPMGSNVTNVQLVTGEIVQAGMTASLRGTRAPESHNLCSSCATHVYGLLHAMTRGNLVEQQ